MLALTSKEDEEMRKRDGKMYIAMYLSKQVELKSGEVTKMVSDEFGTSGFAWVFWTKTAARKIFGRNVELQTISISDQKERT